MPSRSFTKRLLSISTVGLLIAAAVLFVVFRPRTATINTNTSQTAHDRYGIYYQGAWRSDQAQGSILMTATLLVPPAITALGQDNGRSETDQQVWNIVKELDSHTLAIVLTIDSVTGAVPDATIESAVSLKSDHGPAFSFAGWQPLIAPSRVVNTNQPTSSQYGLLLWRAGSPIDWHNLPALQLTIKNVGDQPNRIMTWTEPKLLLQL